MALCDNDYARYKELYEHGNVDDYIRLIDRKRQEKKPVAQKQPEKGKHRART